MCGTYKEYGALCDKLETLYREVAEASMTSEEEGSVLYFTTPLKTVSLCKLKTLEYRILRKLREKLRSFLESNTSDY